MPKIDKAMNILNDYREELIEEIMTDEITINTDLEIINNLWEQRDYTDSYWKSSFVAQVNELKKIVDKYIMDTNAEESVSKAQYELTEDIRYLFQEDQ